MASNAVYHSRGCRIALDNHIRVLPYAHAMAQVALWILRNVSCLQERLNQ